MKEIIFIITTSSEKEKTDRFCGSKDEWSKCWGLEPEHDIFMVKEVDDKKIEPITDIERMKGTDFKRMVCWINAKKVSKDESKALILSFENYQPTVYWHMSRKWIPENFINESHSYSLKNSTKEKWQDFIRTGKKLARKQSKENFDVFFHEFVLKKKFENLKFSVLKLGLKVEGLEKCFIRSGDDKSARDICKQRLDKLSSQDEKYSAVFNDVNQKWEKIPVNCPGGIKISVDSFFNKFKTLGDIKEDKLTDARESLCSILREIETVLK